MTYNHKNPKSFCGVFGVFGHPDSALLTYYGLHALQHRGQEASGMATLAHRSNGSPVINIHKGEGLVSEVYSDIELLSSQLSGTACIGHNRYSTTGASGSRKNIQPFYVHYRDGNLAIAHNGNLTNEQELRTQLVSDGAIFQTTSDTEVVLHLIAKSRKSGEVEQVLDALRQVEGAYCLLILTDNSIIAARDPNGFRPLMIGKKDNAFVVASESCAFDIINATFIREVEPGELLVINDHSLSTGEIASYRITDEQRKLQQCIFEYIYFSRPDSRIFGHNVDKVRRRLGKQLAKHYPVFDKDGERVIVISVPDSSNTAALGYATELEKVNPECKLEIGLIRSHYIGRTFIRPGQHRREVDVRIKFNVVKGVIEGRTVVVLDDSIVRGTTSKLLMQLLREANPKELHLRIASPPITAPCYYGMDFPTKAELIAARLGDVESIRAYLGVESLHYLTVEQMLEAVYEDNPEHYCTACFTGNYPTAVNRHFSKDMYEL